MQRFKDFQITEQVRVKKVEKSGKGAAPKWIVQVKKGKHTWSQVGPEYTSEPNAETQAKQIRKSHDAKPTHTEEVEALGEVSQKSPSWNKVTGTVTKYELDRAKIDSAVAAQKKAGEAKKKADLAAKMKASSGSLAGQLKPIKTEEVLPKSSGLAKKGSPIDQRKAALSRQIQSIRNTMKNMERGSPIYQQKAKEILNIRANMMKLK